MRNHLTGRDFSRLQKKFVPEIACSIVQAFFSAEVSKTKFFREFPVSFSFFIASFIL